jgi:hypothetical protein
MSVTATMFELGKGMTLVPVDDSAGKGLPLGTVLHWGGNMGWAECDYCIVAAVPDTGFGGGYECFDIEHPDKNATLHRIEWHSVKREDDPAVWHSQHFFVTNVIHTPEQVKAYLEQHKAQRAAFDAAKAAEGAEAERLTEIGRRLWHELGFAGAEHIIIAEHEVDDSDIQTDYFSSHTSDTVVLARSEHGRDIFSELRKAALLIPETEHLGPGCDEWRVMLKSHPDNGRTWDGRLASASGKDTFTTEAEAQKVLTDALAQDEAQKQAVPFVPFCPKVPYGADVRMESVEHREKYSGGHGFYLAMDRHSGWQVRKVGVGNDGGCFIAIAKRHDHLLKKQETVQAASVAEKPSNVQVTENEEMNGVEIRFPSRPDEATLTLLKSHGWRWSRFSGCWYNRRTDETKAFAERIATCTK